MRDVILPKLGLTMTRGAITRWCKQPGEAVAVGDVLFTFESDKASGEAASECSGVLAEILVPAGDEADVFAVVARIMEDCAQRSVLQPSAPQRRVNASPLARKLAAEHGIELSTIAPADGARIEKKDVEAAIAALVEPARAAVPVRPVATVDKPAPVGPEEPAAPVSQGYRPSWLMVELSMDAFDALCSQLENAGDMDVRARLLSRAARAAWDGEPPGVLNPGNVEIDGYIPGSCALPVLGVARKRVVLVFDDAQMPVDRASRTLVQFARLLETPTLFLAR